MATNFDKSSIREREMPLAVDALRSRLAWFAIGGSFAGGVLGFDFAMLSCLPLVGAFAYPTFAVSTDFSTPRFAAPESTESRLRSFARAPFIAGGSRVASFFVATAALCWLGYMAGRGLTHRPSNLLADDDPIQFALLLAYGVTGVLAPRLVCRMLHGVERPVVLYFVVLAFGWVVAAYSLSAYGLGRAVDPQFLCSQVAQDGRMLYGRTEVAVLAASCAATVLAHVPEMLRGLRELSPPSDALTQALPASPRTTL